uniref:HAT C-terminal dimerisation domain-containing protein n=1 Tax=Meloidogyne incognita TaxID=6306 RepID=A0A914M0T9_MELIC
MDMDEIEKTKISEPDIAISLRAKSPWDKDGDKRNMINKFLMEMICVDLQPLSIVENIGFRRLVNELQPRYKIPSRSQVTRNLLPQMFTSLKLGSFLSAPCTSAEAERLFSSAGLIINNLRKRLIQENAEMLLFLHHNLVIYNFEYE